MHRTRTLLVLLLSLALAPLLACNTQAKWTYPIDPQNLWHAPAQHTDLVIGVLPFREDRPVMNRAATRSLYLIPLMPFGWVTYERPEAAVMFDTLAKYDFDMGDDLGKAAARSLDQSGLFRRVYFTQGGETREADYLFQGTAKRTLYEGKTYSYGLSLAGPVLWILGLPAGSSKNEMVLEYQLVDPDGHPVWSYSTAGEASVVQGYYYNWGEDVIGFATLMEMSMNDALRDLAGKVGELHTRSSAGTERSTGRYAVR